MLKPGLLTEKFNIGQRASYAPPFRLYVFVSIVIFFVLALRAGHDDATATAKQAPVMLPDQGVENPAFKSAITKVVSFAKSGEQSQQKLLKNTSFMMFLLMPFFGFTLYLFYYWQGRNYMEHLMFSVHFHTFFFLLPLLALGVEYIYSGFEVDSWIFFISLIYLFFALHRVYRSSCLRTF